MKIDAEADLDILNIIRELKTYRMMMGMSLRELAGRSGIGRFVIAEWENERRVPDMVSLRIWAETLGYKVRVTVEVPD